MPTKAMVPMAKGGEQESPGAVPAVWKYAPGTLPIGTSVEPTVLFRTKCRLFVHIPNLAGKSDFKKQKSLEIYKMLRLMSFSNPSCYEGILGSFGVLGFPGSRLQGPGLRGL